MTQETLRALDLYAAHQRARNYTEGTITACRRRMNAFARWCGGDILEVTQADVEAYLGTLRVSPRTRYNYIARLSAFYTWATDEGHVAENPVRKIQRPRRPRDLPRPIPAKDLLHAVELAEPEMRCWLLFAAFAGLRCKEIAGIMVDDIRRDIATPTLLVSNPKGNRERGVPIHPDLDLALVEYGIPRSGYLFPHFENPGEPIQPWKVSHDGGAFLRSVGVDATMHQLRHFFASSVYAASQDLRLTQELMGHASPTTTAVYAAWDQGRAAEVVSGLSIFPEHPTLRVVREQGKYLRKLRANFVGEGVVRVVDNRELA